LAGALDGLRVLDLTSVVLGPLATQTMGDMGADIVKIESPAGDTTRYTGPKRSADMSALYMGLNRNKRSLVLDLKQDAAKDALWRLIDTADVFLHSVRPQAMERLGFGHDAVLARNPRIIYAGIHGFRMDGPYAGRPAYDDVIQGLSGSAHHHGRQDLRAGHRQRSAGGAAGTGKIR
jgi:crotonobetainyl-CoA:carnitine CoA-transferase CaiB-like acyl-CoA transferase